MSAPLSELAITDETVLYLRPLCGAVAAAMPGARIGGAWAGFDHVEVIARQGAKVARATVALDDFGPWSASLGVGHKERIETLLTRITDRRQPMAGITFDQPRFMGVLNVTPDSFSDGGDYATAEAAIGRGRELIEGGAAVLDIGGESTQPGSDPVPVGEELRRVMPVIEALAHGDTGAVISIDSRKARVMEEATAAGAAIINDISALTGDARALSVAASSGAHVILMHCQGEPKTMQEAPVYDQPPLEIFDYLEGRIGACEAAGIVRGRIAIDPGIGFGKALAHNLAILSHLSLFQGLGCPVLLGVSRKRFIAYITGAEGPKERLPGSLAAAMAGLAQGVQMLRVHDATETNQAMGVWQAIHGAGAID
ncbi:MAG: dihydropteroate synthase [Alphaproteobacteria bacterium]|nr:dihydropteroate synthase [Alphaproteobacteria bacterium]